MSAMTSLIIGIAGCGGLAAIAYMFMGFVNKKSDKRKAEHGILQKLGIKKLITVEEKQTPIIKKIEESDLISKETKNKIKVIKEEVNKKVIEILKTETFEELSKKEDELW